MGKPESGMVWGLEGNLPKIIFDQNKPKNQFTFPCPLSPDMVQQSHFLGKQK